MTASEALVSIAIVFIASLGCGVLALAGLVAELARKFRSSIFRSRKEISSP